MVRAGGRGSKHYLNVARVLTLFEFRDHFSSFRVRDAQQMGGREPAITYVALVIVWACLVAIEASIEHVWLCLIARGASV